MKDGVDVVAPMRGVIVGTLTGCLLLVMAPWMSGGQQPLAMMMSGGALLLGALLVWRQPEARRLKWGPLALTWWLLMGFGVLSLGWSISRYSTGLWLVQWLMAGLAFWLAYTLAGEERGREWLVRGYMGSALLFCGVAIWMYLTGTYDRLTGTFYWANPAAAYLLPAILVAVDRMRRGMNKQVYGWLAVSVILLVSFWLTDSRGAGLVLVITGVLYLVLVPTPKRFWIYFVFSLGLSLAVSLGLAKASNMFAHHGPKQAPGARLAEVATGESQSLKDRLNYLGSGFEIWFSHPVGGTGAGTYAEAHPQYQNRVVSASSSAHNIYVQLLAELGLVGAALVAGVLLWLVLGLVRGLALAPGTLPLVLGVVGLLLHFGLDIDARYPALLALVAVLAGLVYRQHNEARGAVSWRLAVVAAVVLVPLVSLYQSDVWAHRAQVDQDDGGYDLAADHYAAAAQGLLYDPDVLSAEGINLYALGSAGGKDAKATLEAALERARQAERMDPWDGQHHQLEGRVLAALGRGDEAQAAFREALRLDPYNHPDYAYDLAAAQLRAGDAAGAVQTARDMLAQYPPAVVANRSADASVRPAVAGLEVLMGNVDLQQGRLAEAEKAARSALSVNPGNLGARALEHQVEVARPSKPAE
jgi:O-antigen ligase